MFIAQVENEQVIKVVDYRDVFGRSIPTDEQLVEKSYVRVNLFREHDRLTQKLITATPVLEGGWVYTVAVAQMSEEEIQAAKDSAMAQIRGTRNSLLLACDWTQIADCTIPKKAEWATYRQTLRDLPSTVTGDSRTFTDWPHNPDWVEPLGNGMP
jgi:hypothetical protein